MIFSDGAVVLIIMSPLSVGGSSSSASIRLQLWGQPARQSKKRRGPKPLTRIETVKQLFEAFINRSVGRVGGGGRWVRLDDGLKGGRG